MTKRKILFIINKFKLGGAEMMVAAQANLISRRNYETMVISLYPNQSETNLAKRLSPAVEYHELGFKSLWDFDGWFRLYRLIKARQFAVVITNLFDADVIGRITAIIARIPIIITYEHSQYPDKHRWQIWLDRFLAPFTDKIIVGSTQVKDFTIKQEKLPGDKFLVNYNSLELEFDDDRGQRDQVLAEFGLPTDCLYLVTAGRLVEQKGHRYLLKAIKQLKTENRLGKVKVLIFGEGVLASEFKQYLDEHNLHNEVKFYPPADMHQILAMADIFVLPSLWEGLSLALISAMNAGCPILGTKISGTLDAIQIGESGVLVPAGDSDSLAEAIVSLAADPKQRARLGRAAAIAAQNFSIEKNVDRLTGLIDSLWSKVG